MRALEFGWLRWSAIVAVPLTSSIVLAVLAWWTPWVSPALFQGLLAMVAISCLCAGFLGLWDGVWFARLGLRIAQARWWKRQARPLRTRGLSIRARAFYLATQLIVLVATDRVFAILLVNLARSSMGGKP